MILILEHIDIAAAVVLVAIAIVMEVVDKIAESVSFRKNGYHDPSRSAETIQFASIAIAAVLVVHAGIAMGGF